MKGENQKKSQINKSKGTREGIVQWTIWYSV